MKINTSPYSKTLFIWQNASAFFMYGPVTPLHSHNTMQVAFGINGPFKCRLAGSSWQQYEAVIIGEDVLHQLDPCGGIQLLIYLDARSHYANALRREYLAHSSIAGPETALHNVIKPGVLETCLMNPDAQVLGGVVEALLLALTGAGQRTAHDARVQQVLGLLAGNNEDNHSIAQLARAVFLSESRLRALFKQQTGIPLHRYILWSRLLRGAQYMMNGSTVQEAAAAGGFTDTSHFYRMMLQMFGVHPAQFIKNNNQKNIIICSTGPMLLESRFYEAGCPEPVFTATTLQQADDSPAASA